MCISHGRKRLPRACTALLLVIVVATSAQAQASEESAFEAARAKTEPQARIDALQHFLQQFPSGSRSVAAEQDLLDTYLANFPDNTGQIHTTASALLARTTPGFDRWTEEARLAA